MTEKIDDIGTANSKSNRDKLDNEGFRKMMLCFNDEYPIDRIFQQSMSKNFGNAKARLDILLYAEIRRVRYVLEEICKKMK